MIIHLRFDPKSGRINPKDSVVNRIETYVQVLINRVPKSPDKADNSQLQETKNDHNRIRFAAPLDFMRQLTLADSSRRAT